MSTTKTTRSLAIVAATAGLMLVATADTSFARGRGYPSCEASCQANKASRLRLSRTERPCRAQAAGQMPAEEITSSSERRLLSMM